MRYFPTLLAILLASALAGCGMISPKPDSEQVRERATARMDALIARDFERAYSFMSPGYRSTHSVEQYKSTIGPVVKPVSAKVGDISCDEDVCAVQIDVTFLYRGRLSIVGDGLKGGDITRMNEEKWIKVDGRWWYYDLR